jgi:phage shock protein A
MTLITRVSRLFKADVHGILDALEEPEAILKQAVREMEDEIEKSRLHKKKLDKKIESFGTVKKNQISKLESTEKKIY